MFRRKIYTQGEEREIHSPQLWVSRGRRFRDSPRHCCHLPRRRGACSLAGQGAGPAALHADRRGSGLPAGAGQGGVEEPCGRAPGGKRLCAGTGGLRGDQLSRSISAATSPVLLTGTWDGNRQMSVNKRWGKQLYSREHTETVSPSSITY